MAEIIGIKKINSIKTTFCKNIKLYIFKLFIISQKNPRKTNPEKISTKKYLGEIFFLHFLHFPKRKIQDKIGTNSDQLKFCEQFGHFERRLILFQKLFIFL